MNKVRRVEISEVISRLEKQKEELESILAKEQDALSQQAMDLLASASLSIEDAISELQNI